MSLFRRRSSRRASLACLAALCFVPFQTPSQPAPASQQGGEKDEAAIFQAMNDGHTQFRKAVLAELHKVATKRNQKIDFPSLIITSCSDTCMLAGVAASRAGGEAQPAAGAAKLDTKEPLGLVAVAGSFLSVHSRTTDASGPNGQVPGRAGGAVSTVKLRPGFYAVRRGPRANLLELVDLKDQVAVTISFQPPGAGREGPRGAPDANSELSEASEWPTVFMELLHSVDLGAGH